MGIVLCLSSVLWKVMSSSNNAISLSVSAFRSTEEVKTVDFTCLYIFFTYEKG